MPFVIGNVPRPFISTPVEVFTLIRKFAYVPHELFPTGLALHEVTLSFNPPSIGPKSVAGFHSIGGVTFKLNEFVKLGDNSGISCC